MANNVYYIHIWGGLEMYILHRDIIFASYCGKMDMEMSLSVLLRERRWTVYDRAIIEMTQQRLTTGFDWVNDNTILAKILDLQAKLVNFIWRMVISSCASASVRWNGIFCRWQLRFTLYVYQVNSVSVSHLFCTCISRYMLMIHPH